MARIQKAVDTAAQDLKSLGEESARLAAELEQAEKDFANKALAIQGIEGKTSQLLQQISEKEAEKEKLRLQEQALADQLLSLKADIEARKTKVISIQERMKVAQDQEKSLDSSTQGAA